jgi:outer membrane immunogenic protein
VWLKFECLTLEAQKEIARSQQELASLKEDLAKNQDQVHQDAVREGAAGGPYSIGNPAHDEAIKALYRDFKQQDELRDKIADREGQLDVLNTLPPCPEPPKRTGMAPALPGTGFYVGFNAGGALGSSRWLEPAPAVSTNTFRLSGGLAGGTVGYTMQSESLLLGVEADIAGGGISGSTSIGCFTPCRTSNSFLATVRGRAGISFGAVTPFVTGGLAVGDVNADVGAFSGAGTTKTGWTAGAGLQLPLSALLGSMPEAWVGKAEWLHVDLGNPHVCTPATCGGNANVKFQADVFRVGINIPLTTLIPQ